MFTKRAWYLRLALVTAFAAGLAACGDSTGPAGEFDPTAESVDVTALSDAVATNPALQSMNVLGDAIGATFAVLPLPLDPAIASQPSTLKKLSEQMSALRAAVGVGSFQLSAVIPENLWGRTYVYDPLTNGYVWDPGRTGAPGTGVRFILYAVDPIFGQVVQPLQEIGYIDITDETTTTTDQIHIVAVIGAVTHVDYRLIASFTTTSGTIRAVGFISNGSQQLNFDIRIQANQDGSLVLDYLLHSPSDNVRLHLVTNFQFDSATETLTVSLTFEIRSARGTALWTLTITESPTGSSLSGEVRFNGRRVVVISGTPQGPVFTKADGTELTAEELQALQGLFEIPDSLIELLDGIFGPAGLFAGAG